MKKLKLLSVYLLFQILTFEMMAQNVVHQYDTICSFVTHQGETISLMKNLQTNLLLFMMKSPLNIPETWVESTHSDTLFTYSYYLRGGAATNEGMELNYVYFNYKNAKYVIYEISHYSEQQSHVGLKIIDSKTNATLEKNAKLGSIKGSITALRDSNLVKHGEELFD